MEVLKPGRNVSVVILGTGGFAVELESILSSAGILVKGFVGPRPVQELPGPWLGGDDVIQSYDKNVNWIVAVGDPILRQKLSMDLRSEDIQPVTFVHDSAYISASSKIGKGCVIYPNSAVHAKVQVHDGVLVNSNVTVGHETTIGNFSNLSPGVAVGGRCNIGKCVHIGIGASLRDQIKIVSNSVIGAGATVVSDIKIPGKYVGVPAKMLRN